MSKRKTPASRPVWSGAISFGLVTIPVKLYTAVREKRLHFRSLHDQDKVPLKQKLICPAHGKEVHPEHIVKGFEIDKDQFVIVHEDELEAAAPKTSRSIEILDFVELEQIDPLYFNRPYYVSPQSQGAKPYKLLVDAMEKKKKVAIAKVVMHAKEYLVAVRPLDGGLVLETMHFADEVVAAASVPGHEGKTRSDARELKIAEQLVDSLTTDFDPSKYHDDYREAVMKLIEQKAEGEEIVHAPEEDTEDKPARSSRDLMSALEASLASAKAGSGTRAHPVHGRTLRHARRRRSA
jgi:DNA end-binding protein Ku